MLALVAGMMTLSLVSTAAAADTNTNTEKKTTSTVVLACMQTAVDTREKSIQSGETTLHGSWSTALTTRHSALMAAWNVADQTQRRTDIKAAWKAFRQSKRTAFKTWRENRNAAWKTFNDARKACNASANDDKTTKGVDAAVEPTK